MAQESVKYWESAVTKLETLSAKLEELPERADVMIAVGNIWEHKLERRDQAMMQYQRAFKVWPYKTEALDLARNIYASQKNWKLVSRLYDLELQVEKDPVKRAAIHVHKARIASEDLDEIEESVALLRKALELDPESKDARAMLSALTNEAPVWEDKLAKLREDVERAGKGTSAAGLHVSIAQLLMDNDPTSEDIEKELKDALAIVPHHAEARDLICEVYRREGRWEELSRLLETIASDQMTRKEVARQALIELAALQRDQFDDEAASVATFERLLALDPSHPDALRFAQRFYEENEDWTALVGLYDNALKLKRSTPDELELRIALGEVLWQKVEDLPPRAPLPACSSGRSSPSRDAPVLPALLSVAGQLEKILQHSCDASAGR